MNTFNKNAGEIGRAIRNRKFELTESGLLLRNGSNLFIGGAMKHTLYGADGSVDCRVDHNLVVNQGLDHILNAAFPPTGGYAPITAWFIAPFSGNYTPDPALTAAAFPAAATEFTAYTLSTRLPLVIGAASTAQSTGNSGAEAVMTLNAGGPYNIYGAAIVSVSTKSSTGGKCAAAVAFDSPRLNMAGGDRLGLEYVLTATDAA